MLYRSFRVSGLGLDQLLQQAASKGITLLHINRIDLRTLDVSCYLPQCQALESLAARLGFILTELPPRGAYKRFLSFKNHRPLIAAALVMLLVLSLSLQLIWHVEIINGGIYSGEVRRVLTEQNIHPGLPRSAVSTDDLRDALTARLPHAAWVRVEYKGLTLCIEIIHGVPSPDIENAGVCGNIIAAKDGVIDRIQVYAGTPAVRPGDTVQKGDILIHGYEKRGNDSTVPVRARGKITARVYLQESAAGHALGYISERTGRSAERFVLGLPFFRFSFSKEPDYLSSERETEVLHLTNVFLPVWVEKETIYEIALHEESSDISAVKAEVSRLAMQKLLSQVSRNDEIIDKWLDYSMIEGGIILATATAEILTELSEFSPQTPD